MSSAPSTSIASDVHPVTDIRELKSALRLDLQSSLNTLKRHQNGVENSAADLVNRMKTPSLADIEKIIAEGMSKTIPFVLF